MTTETGMSLSDLGRRIDLNVKSGWGLEKGTSAQLNLLALYCQKHRLLPGDDVTLYEGKPWITLDGRVKLMRRNKDEYRGHTLRPLTPEEKKAWGWDPEDIVIEAIIHTVTYGEIQGYGRVSKLERAGQGNRPNPVAKNNPVEMATKRALSRAERMAFGTEAYVDDEDVDNAVRTLVSEQKDPEWIATNAATYKRIYGEDEPIEAPPPELDAEVQDALIENEALLRDAKDVGVGVGVLKRNKADPSRSLSDIAAANAELRDAIAGHRQLL